MDFLEYSRQLRQRRPRDTSLVVLESATSTQTLARRITDEYLREGSDPPKVDVVAWAQHGGRGRHDRSWASPPGCGLYATLVRHVDDRARLQRLPLEIAVALAQSINLHLDGRCRLKWPNDLVIGSRKLGGLLLEGLQVGERGAAIALVGLGINHASDLSVFEAPQPTSWGHEEKGPGVLLPGMASILLKALDAALESAPPLSEVLTSYRELSAHTPGERIRCQVGAEIVKGVFQGFDEHGFLRLGVGGAERRLSVGEVLGEPPTTA